VKINLLKVMAWVVLPIGLIACKQQQEEQIYDESVRAVKVFTVLNAATATERKFPGQSSSSVTSILSFPVSGRILKLMAVVGENIDKGQTLAKLDSTSFVLDQQIAEAEYMQSKAIYSEKKSDFDRKASLAKKGMITRNDVEQSESAMKSAQQQMNLTRTKVKLAKNKVLDTILNAPFSGVIAERIVELYEEVSAGQQIVVMEGLGGIDVKIDVPETLLSKITVGQTVQVLFNAFEDVFSARITEIGSKADIGNTFQVKVTLSDTPKGLKSGMSAEVTLNIAQATDEEEEYLIPLSSLVAGDSNSRAYVYIVDSETYLLNKRAITPIEKASLDNFIAVTGVNAGDKIATAGVSFLSDGLKVKRYQAP
jgi:RND family efflux transporter MFP subunit